MRTTTSFPRPATDERNTVPTPEPWAGPDSPLRHTLERLPVRKLVFEHELLDDMLTDPFMGNLWRGQLGAWWHDHAAGTFEALMGLDENSRAWALEADWGDDHWVPAGAMLRTVVTLIGPAVAHESAVIDAMAVIGMRGLGSFTTTGRRAQARLLRAQVQVPGGMAQEDPLLTAADIMNLCAHPAPAHRRIQVDITRPLRFKERGQVFIGVPTLEQLIRRTQGRVVQLLSVVNRDPGVALFDRETQARCIQAARTAECVGHQLQVWTLRRQSGRTGQQMPLEGITGRVRFEGHAQVLLPWLKLAEWLQVGTKTTFGFGVLKIS